MRGGLTLHVKFGMNAAISEGETPPADVHMKVVEGLEAFAAMRKMLDVKSICLINLGRCEDGVVV